jgi:hypothetical protein
MDDGEQRRIDQGKQQGSRSTRTMVDFPHLCSVRRFGKAVLTMERGDNNKEQIFY